MEKAKIKYTMEKLDRMEGHEFEYACAELLRHSGYRDVTVTQGAGDYGIDILARRGSVKYAIQCKRYKSNVSVKAVQEAGVGCDYYRCDAAAVMTNSNFTKQAMNLAKTTGVRLWGRDFLQELIDNYEEEYDVISPPIAVRHGKNTHDAKEINSKKEEEVKKEKIRTKTLQGEKKDKHDNTERTTQVKSEFPKSASVQSIDVVKRERTNNTTILRGEVSDKTIAEDNPKYRVPVSKMETKEQDKVNSNIKNFFRVLFDVIRWILVPIILLIFVIATMMSKGYLAAVFGMVMVYLICPLNRKIDNYYKLAMWIKILLFFISLIAWFIAFGMVLT